MIRRLLALLLPALAAISSFAQSSGNVVVSVDPAGTFTGSWAVEWNTNDNLEGWSPINATVAVTNGVLEGIATTTDSRVQLAGFAGGPDLNLGYNDFLELRIQVPASYTNSIQIFYGTTLTTGFNAARVITIPAALIPNDGAFHTYRLDLGLEVYWRATLRDLRIDAVDGADTTGMGFAIDYLRIGDAPSAAVYQPRNSTECPAAGGTTPSGALIGPSQTVSSMESKHFRFLWNPAVTSNASWTATMSQGTLRNAEECWQILCKKLGYREPCFATGTTSGMRYKVNITTWHSGYWAGLDGSYARLNITPDGLRVDPPTGVLPHEFTHVIQFHNSTGYVPGSWWEGHANYGRERYLQHFGVLFASNQRSGIDPTYLRCAHQILAHGRDYYLSWPMFLYLDENPDGLSDLGEGTNVKLWQQTQINEYPLMALERLTPTNSIKDIVGYFARRGATYNYSTKTDIQAALASFSAPLDNAATARWQFTDLVQRGDDTNWWRVPFEMAPMQGAYAIHELVPIGTGAGRVVTVNLRGLSDSARGADWRASFIVISDTGAERYSPLWGSGTNSVTLAANYKKFYLSVAGAPATFYTGAPNASFEGDFNNAVYPYRSWPSKTRFPYELQVAGATPKVRDNGSTAGLTQHYNGGGYRSVSVPTSVYIGPNARVLGGSVSGNARIEDYAVVSSGTVNGNAVISGHAWVRGGTVTGNAKVRDWALVEGGTISLNGRVLEHANIKGGAVTDIATAKGSAASLSGTLAGNAMIDGDYGDFFSGRNVTNGIAFGHQPYVGVPDNFITPLPTGLYAAYDFATAHDSRILDQYGVTDGFTQGSPTWYASDGRRAGFLAFNGSNQFVALDRSVSDTKEITVTAWVKWSGGSANQPVFFFGSATNKCMYLTPDDGTGNAKFSIVNGGAPQTLAWTSALPIGAWVHVAVTLSNGVTGRLYINGTNVATGSLTILPEQLNAPNTAAGLPQNYLARGAGNSLPFFRGAVDNVGIYLGALSDAEISNIYAPSPVAGTLYVDLRATNSSAGAATWINQGTLGNFTRVNSPFLTNNVAGTGVPGVSFNGTSGAYQGPNSVADIDGGGDRSVEVWAYNPALVAEETMVSWGHRGTDRRDLAFNFGNNVDWGAATHWADDVGWGTPPTANAWHHLVYTYSNALAKVYVDGALRNSKTLGGALDTFTNEPINLACQRDTANGSRSLWFGGFLNSVRVHGGVLTDDQVAANYQLGPWIPPAAPGAIVFAAISNVVLNPGVTLNITNSATDPNQPPLPLTFTILSGPDGATIDATSGLFGWRPTVAQANTTNLITLKVENNATPSLVATQSFVATINTVASPLLSDVQLTNDAFGFLVNGSAGPDYLIQTSTNLSDWETILNTNPAALPFLWTSPILTAEPARFHRVLLGP